ncbi:MAG: flavohemoglobin expression-modulating QEGLA motif protein [Chromatiales bacterium]
MPALNDDVGRHVDLDRQLVEIAQSIRILTLLAWPESVYEDFKRGWQSGNPRLPAVPCRAAGDPQRLVALQAIMQACDRAHPIGNYVYQTAHSYYVAARMLESVGTPAFTELAVELYGKPSDPIAGGDLTHLHAAEFFTDTTGEYVTAAAIPDYEYALSAEEVAKALSAQLVPFFDHHAVSVVVDPAMASKAAAGALRIRLRAATRFSPMDVAQLVHHEGYVHMLTALNGREQPHLGSLGLGAPRTTWTQEGLATFSELVSASVDLSRMRRIALRTRAVQMGLEGADFLEIFRFFLESGQDEYESFQSTARIFRGGDPRGKIVFTKDVVYLQGLLRTHTFLRKAVQSNKFHYAEHLFAGRLTLGDVIALEPFFESGVISPPLYEPPWLRRRSCLAAYLCYSVFANRISLAAISLDDFQNLEQGVDDRRLARSQSVRTPS